MVSYIPKKNRLVHLISSQRDENRIFPEDKNNPGIILQYNETKCGVAKMYWQNNSKIFMWKKNSSLTIHTFYELHSPYGGIHEETKIFRKTIEQLILGKED